MHSCDNDIGWIYDDIGIGIVNIFDTPEAEKFIYNNKSRAGLDDLLRKYDLSHLEKYLKKSFQLSN